MAVQPGVELTEDGPTVGGRVRLTHKSGATCELTRFGAHIVSWKAAVPGGGLAPVERLWMSSLSALDGSAPIRGGIPIAWPQFADLGSLPLHGFARELRWALVSEPGPACSGADIVRAELELSADERTKNGTWREPAAPPFPWEFKLRYARSLAALLQGALRSVLTWQGTRVHPVSVRALSPAMPSSWPKTRCACSSRCSTPPRRRWAPARSASPAACTPTSAPQTTSR